MIMSQGIQENYDSIGRDVGQFRCHQWTHGLVNMEAAQTLDYGYSSGGDMLRRGGWMNMAVDMQDDDFSGSRYLL